MNPTILRRYSDELDPPDSGLPRDLRSFNVRIEVDICDMPKDADSVFFEFYVCSPDHLSRLPLDSFISPTLVIEEFQWKLIDERLEKIMPLGLSSSSWAEIAARWSGLLRPASFDAFPWRE